MREKGVGSFTKGNSAEKGLFLSLCLPPIIDCVGDEMTKLGGEGDRFGDYRGRGRACAGRLS